MNREQTVLSAQLFLIGAVLDVLTRARVPDRADFEIAPTLTRVR
jgi:hypothetical protein